MVPELRERYDYLFSVALPAHKPLRYDFATIMVLLVFACGLIWIFDVLVLARRRRATANGGESPGEGVLPEARLPSRIVEYARSFFPVFLIVLLLRSFLIEPFRIPSGSMMPTLLIGDFILVNKFTYGMRLPVMDYKVIPVDSPKRGDVVVFRYPEDPSTPFIKRVVGLPGDRIGYHDKVLYVNDLPAEQEDLGRYTGTGPGRNMSGASHRTERIGDCAHDILVQRGYSSREGDTVVPPGHYFVLGDNRDNSRDSRYWGTVPDTHLIGRAFAIWLNAGFDHGVSWSRIGTAIECSDERASS